MAAPETIRYPILIERVEGSELTAISVFARDS